jgi:hypothetical protein
VDSSKYTRGDVTAQASYFTMQEEASSFYRMSSKTSLMQLRLRQQGQRMCLLSRVQETGNMD